MLSPAEPSPDVLAAVLATVAELPPSIDDLTACWRHPAPPCTPATDRPAADSPAASPGDAMTQHWPRLYGELRRVAGRLMAQERPDHTLSATALVHEAWLRLGGAGGAVPQVNDRHHFMALATRAMRHILVNHAEARRADKRRGAAVHHTLSAAEAVPMPQAGPEELLALDQALRTLAAEDARAAQVAELKAFGGLEVAEIAQCLGISEPTVKRDWVFARARLARLLG